MPLRFAIALSPSWLGSNRVQTQLRVGRVLAGELTSPVRDRCSVFLRARDSAGNEMTDFDEVRLTVHDGDIYLSSKILAAIAQAPPSLEAFLLLQFEGSTSVTRCVASWCPPTFFTDLEADTSLQLWTYDLPPNSTALVTESNVVTAIRRATSVTDPDLLSVQATRFLDGPHVLERLFDHLMELRSLEAPNFLTVVKGLSDMMRSLLEDERSPIKIMEVAHSHTSLWSSVQGRPISFVDGGIARFEGFPGFDQFVMRVGTYTVTPGVTDPNDREQFSMTSRVLADVIDPAQISEETDRKRLQEAIRFCLELLVFARTLDAEATPTLSFLHGPLVNQFATYHSGKPYDLPTVSEEFLESVGIEASTLADAFERLPPPDASGRPRFLEFMVLYGYLSNQMLRAATPAVGVVERSPGRLVTYSVMDTLEDRGVMSTELKRRIDALLRQYGVTDDLLFGCVLKEREYLSPVTIRKIPQNRATPDWQPVVRQFLQPRATLLKPSDSTFPLRLELNYLAADLIEGNASIAYHTARLLPRYAFPVGLDIVDKYAKVPDWMSRAIGAAGSAALLKRALELTDDPRMIAAYRRQLIGRPRDFFFRPSAH